MKYAIFLFAFSMVLCTIACGSDDEASACDTSDVTYTNTIQAIFANNGCTDSGCHPSAFSAANFSLASYNDVVNFNRLPTMIDALRWQNGAQEMPRDSTSMPFVGLEMLPDCDIDKIEAWLANGLPE